MTGMYGLYAETGEQLGVHFDHGAVDVVMKEIILAILAYMVSHVLLSLKNKS